MKQIILLFSIIAIVSCSDNKNNNILKPEPDKLVLNITSKIKTLYPPAINDISSMQVASQIYEGLVKYNSYDLKIVPAIAESWKINDDNTEYTFKLRKGISFQNNECFTEGTGRIITANDVKYSFTQLCSQQHTNNNFISTMLHVKGAKKYYEKSKDEIPNTEIEGLLVIDDYTFRIILEKPLPYFLNSLALTSASIFPKEAFEKYGEKLFVGSGPYYLKKYPNDIPFMLLKNENYYKIDDEGFSLPYIDTIEIGIGKSILTDIQEFEKGKVDIIMNIPQTYISEFMEENIKKFESNPPLYIITKYSETTKTNIYNIYKSNIHNFFTNNLNYIDLSIVYFEEPNNIENDSTNFNKKNL